MTCRCHRESRRVPTSLAPRSLVPCSLVPCFLVPCSSTPSPLLPIPCFSPLYGCTALNPILFNHFHAQPRPVYSRCTAVHRPQSTQNKRLTSRLQDFNFTPACHLFPLLPCSLVPLCPCSLATLIPWNLFFCYAFRHEKPASLFRCAIALPDGSLLHSHSTFCPLAGLGEDDAQQIAAPPGVGEADARRPHGAGLRRCIPN